MDWDEQNVHLVGESLRGMQSSHLGNYSEIGAGARGGALAQLAQRFNPHAPVSKRMRSPYRDSTQISISATGTFTVDSWAGSVLPTLSGLTRVYKSFKPEKAILTEYVSVLFQNSVTSKVRSVYVREAADLVLTSAFSGADNCFPNAPTEATGIPGPALANIAYGNGISWPTINGGIDMTVTFACEPTTIHEVDPPDGFTDDDIVQIVVKARLALLGPSLR